jgi:hypothetical protein
MNPLQSRQRGRFIPEVEVLEDRSLLNASLIGGQIVTTGEFNVVVITDDGQLVRVFSQNGFVGSFFEGTPLTVRARRPGSRNVIDYDLQGFSPSGPNLNVSGTLNVRFGVGSGTLNVTVTSALPTGLFGAGPVSDLTDASNVQITTTSTAGGSGGGTQESLNVASIGANALLSMKDFGGGGNNSFQAGLFGVQKANSTVVLSFFGNAGNDTAIVRDTQDIQAGATTAIDLHGGPGRDAESVFYAGQLQGRFQGVEDEGPGVDTLFLQSNLFAGSNGALVSFQNGGPGNDQMFNIVHKASGDSPTVFADIDGGPGNNQASITTGNLPTNVFVATQGVQTVIPVN